VWLEKEGESGPFSLPSVQGKREGSSLVGRNAGQESNKKDWPHQSKGWGVALPVNGEAEGGGRKWGRTFHNNLSIGNNIGESGGEVDFF